MIRVFIKDVSRYHKAGDERDYPLTVWRRSFPGYEKFTKEKEEVIAAGLERQKGKHNARTT